MSAEPRNGRIVGTAQAPVLRVPFADGTVAATPGLPADDMIPSLLALSDVMGTGWFAADAANVKPGSVVAVVGDGAVGLLGVLSAREMDAERIIVISSHESRQRLALEFGATDIVAERSDEGVARVKDLTSGIGVDSVLERVGTRTFGRSRQYRKLYTRSSQEFPALRSSGIWRTVVAEANTHTPGRLAGRTLRTVDAGRSAGERNPPNSLQWPMGGRVSNARSMLIPAPESALLLILLGAAALTIAKLRRIKGLLEVPFPLSDLSAVWLTGLLLMKEKQFKPAKSPVPGAIVHLLQAILRAHAVPFIGLHQDGIVRRLSVFLSHLAAPVQVQPYVLKQFLRKRNCGSDEEMKVPRHCYSVSVGAALHADDKAHAPPHRLLDGVYPAAKASVCSFRLDVPTKGQRHKPLPLNRAQPL